MAVKIKTPDGMKQIDTTLHKPVIFIDGQKKILDKAWMFVNGEKKMLWGKSGVVVDLITAEVESGTFELTGIADDWMLVGNSGANVILFDIKNLSSPVQKSSVAWGGLKYSGYQTTDGQYVFYGENGSILNKVLVNPNTGVASVSESYTSTFNGAFLAKTNYWMEYLNLSVSYHQTAGPSIGGGTTIVYQYGTQWAFNSSVRFTTGRRPANANDGRNPYMFRFSNGGIQVNDTSVLLNIASDGYSTGAGSYLLNYNGFTKLGNTVSRPFLLDGDRVLGQAGYLYYTGHNLRSEVFNMHTLILYDSVAFQEIARFTVNENPTGKPSHRMAFLGRNGNYYYVIKSPYEAQVGGVSLILLSKDDLSVVYEMELPSDPFNEYNGMCNYYLSGRWIGYPSQTGFVGFSGATTSGNTVGRIMRFSALM